ncbi:Peptidyl-prolyl cis-trans isomerase Mip [Candidatus Clavichlamydia salmonicola]|uniref:FKBP-type peptidyl-prolyl cis-trans isomerase n=1 Tax=Candidatus Clavichlamydia salmonicola TaxID=469812 RepID=UPI0018913ACD|nr:FKBP-type peptidyl-prolyl cis-trans isomerase [Candidatus Clavichlamydia salmonicola]MBF5050740.1 Peptidyl-prolyl cis-trans isomerase Mip [Candidatus Clavichlamydia salmonicola]
MKKIKAMTRWAIFLGILCCPWNAIHANEEGISLKQAQSLSKTLGHLLARQLLQSGDYKIDLKIVIEGMQDEVKGLPAPMTEEEYEDTLNKVRNIVMEKEAAENLVKAEKFLKKNAENPGVIELQEGKIQYLIEKEGTGPVVSAAPLLHYTGRFEDGTVFSSSYEHKEPIVLPLTQTIPGFSLGVSGMREGEKRTLFLHPDYAYGTSGQLPPNALLIFDIEIIKADGQSEK